MGLTLEEYNSLSDILIKLKRLGTEEQKKAAHALLLTIEKPEGSKKMTEQEIRAFYRKLFGFLNE